jgi:L-histidine N-alpha-methyltransferase
MLSVPATSHRALPVARFPHRTRRNERPAPPRAALLTATPPRPVPNFEHDVLNGLAQRRKSIPSMWLYDHRGSELFEAITRLDEYDLTRREMQLLEQCAPQIAEEAGPGATLIELGSGSSRKTSLLLDALDAPRAYLPIDISGQFLGESVAALRQRHAGLRILPVVADFTRLDSLPELTLLDDEGGVRGRRVVFFPGSTLGNFTPDAAVALLRRIAQAVGPDALLVVGADSTRDPALLIPAYDDRLGVTAAFNLNLLRRINRELDANFSLDAFRHEARFDAEQRRVEMHLVSLYTQRVTVRGRPFMFAMGESIHTENSYKYSLPRFQQLAAQAGWALCQRWVDGQSRFAIHVLARRDQNVKLA